MSKVEDNYTLFTESDNQQKIIFIQNDPINLYNKFIRIYNKQNNRVNDIELYCMKQSRIVKFVHSYLYTNWGMIILISIFLLLPFLNILFYLILWIAWFQLYKNGLIHDQNMKLLIDPFQNMVENGDICMMMHQNYWEFNMDVGGQDGLVFSSQIKNMIKTRSKSDSGFRLQYYGFPNQKLYYMKWILLYTCLLAIQMTLIIIFFKDI